MRKYAVYVWGALLAVLSFVGSASAAATTPLDSVTLDTTLFMTGAGIVFVALAAIWPIHKIVKMFNKS